MYLGSILLSQVHHSVSAVESGSDLLVCLHKSLQFNVKVLVLSLQNVAVLVNGIAFLLDILIPLEKVLVIESEVLLLLFGGEELIFSLFEARLFLEDFLVHCPVSILFGFRLSA